MVWAVSLLTMDLSTHCLTPGIQVYGIRSLTELGNPCGPRTQSVLYLHDLLVPRLALKLFRGEPAISEFDWNFSAITAHPMLFQQQRGSVLHEVLPSLQPGHG